MLLIGQTFRISCAASPPLRESGMGLQGDPGIILANRVPRPALLCFPRERGRAAGRGGRTSRTACVKFLMSMTTVESNRIGSNHGGISWQLAIAAKPTSICRARFILPTLLLSESKHTN